MRVRTVLLIPVVLVAMALVLPVSGYQYTFQDSDISDWSAVISGTAVTTITSSFDDLICIRVSKLGDGRVINSHSYPTTYWAATAWMQAGDDHFKLYLYDEAVTYETGISGSTTDDYSVRREIYYRGGNLYQYYTNGVLGGNLTASTAYYLVLGSYDGGGTGYAYFDDIVIGSGEEKDVVSCPPQEWFFGYDIFEPLFSGLYSAPGTLEYQDDMHISYANDDGAMTLVMSNVETSAVVNTTIISDYCGIVTYNLTDILIDSGADYGFYRIESSGHSASDTFVYKGITTAGTDVVWDDTSYTDGETATMTYSISATHWVPATYKYYLKILGTDISELESWEITSQPTSENQTVDVDTDTFPVDGYYYAALYAVDRSSLEEILMVYDTAYMDVDAAAGTVTVSGTTYDAVNSTALGSCTVTATQAGSPHTTTSNAIDGSYLISGLTTSFSIGMNASKTDWMGFPVYFTPYASGTYTVDLALIPWVAGAASPGSWVVCSGGHCTGDSSSSTTTDYWNATTDGTGVGGLIYNEPYWAATSGVTVTISNATWNATTTTGAGGWYQFNETADDVCAGTYTIAASKSGYDTTSTTIVCVEDEFNRKDLCLGTDFDLTVYCRDLDSGGLITGTEVTVDLDTGDMDTTTTGSCTFTDVDYGVVGITGSAVGYYPGTSSCVMDADKTETVYLTAETLYVTNNTGSGIAYPPKTVRFSVMTIWGKPIEDCQVNCTGYETTVGDWDWLYKIFGVDCNETPIATADMGGFTDYKGDIDFVMFEPVKYNCTFVKAGECNETLTIYSKDDHYQILAGGFGNATAFVGGEDLNEAVTCNVTTTTIDPTHANITVSYYDSSGGTTGGTCYLNQTNPVNKTAAEITVSSCAVGGNSWTHTFSVTNQAGESYYVRVQPTHSTWDFERDFAVTFPENKVNPLNLTDNELMFIACFIILFTGLLFGAISAPHAPLIMCFLGWIFLAFGWMDPIILAAAAVLVLASVLSVLNLVMVRSKKERFI